MADAGPVPEKNRGHLFAQSGAAGEPCPIHQPILVYVQTLKLKNIRGFQHLDFDFRTRQGQHHGWFVVTGENGSGKTTLLRCLAACLTGTDAFLYFRSPGHWVSSGATLGELSSILRFDSDDQNLDDQLQDNEPLSFGFQIANYDAATPLDLQTKYSVWPKFERLFSCGYGPYRRLHGASHSIQIPTSYALNRFATLFFEEASMLEVDTWLRTLQHKHLEGNSKASRQLEIVLSLLRDELLPNEMNVEGVDSDGLWLQDRNGVRLGWSEMSDGYRAALTLSLDILRHIFACYGETAFYPGSSIFQRSGVVLIDEVDAHLHPEWQRDFGGWLKRHFPKIQFIVTSHSPLICQAADAIFVLPAPASEEQPRRLTEQERLQVVAGKPDFILRSPAFGLENTASPEVVESKSEWADLQGLKRAGATLTIEQKQRMKELEPVIEAARLSR